MKKKKLVISGNEYENKKEEWSNDIMLSLNIYETKEEVIEQVDISSNSTLKEIDGIVCPDFDNVDVLFTPNEIRYIEIENSIPKKTNLCCWWCFHTFENKPCFAPYKYSDKTNMFQIYGNFCSLSCVKAYLLDNPLYKMKDILLTFDFMVFKTTGIRCKIKKAPERYLLKEFGGYLTIEEFRNLDINRDIKIVKFPFIPIRTYTQETRPLEKINKVPKGVKLKVNNNNVPELETKKKGLGFKRIKKNP